jgi:hypothetical protein
MRSDLDHCSLESCWLIALYISLKGCQLLRNPKALSPFAIAIASPTTQAFAAKAGRLS